MYLAPNSCIHYTTGDTIKLLDKDIGFAGVWSLSWMPICKFATTMLETPLRDHTFFSGFKHELQSNDFHSELKEVCLIGQRHVTTRYTVYQGSSLNATPFFWSSSIFLVNVLKVSNISCIFCSWWGRLLNAIKRMLKNFCRTAFEGNQSWRSCLPSMELELHSIWSQ